MFFLLNQLRKPDINYFQRNRGKILVLLTTANKAASVWEGCRKMLYSAVCAVLVSLALAFHEFEHMQKTFSRFRRTNTALLMSSLRQQ